MEFIITDNLAEKLKLTWDGERFALLCSQFNNTKENPGLGVGTMSVIILNPIEAHKIAEKIREVEIKEYHEGGKHD